MKKKMMITSLVILLMISSLWAFLKIRGSNQSEVTLFVDSIGVEKSETIKTDGKPTVESMADMLSDWTGLDFELNHVEIDGDRVTVDWDLDASLFSEIESIKPKEGFHFDDLESLQWFMLDSLAQTLRLNMGFNTVYFTMNDGAVLNLTIILLMENEPYENSAFFLAHEDNKGDESESQYSYYDNEHQLLLTYPSVFSEKSIVNDKGNISFPSKQDDAELQYWVTPNTNNDTLETFYNSLIWEEVEMIKADNVVVGRGKEVNRSSGELIYYTTYTFVEAHQIATVSITSENDEESAFWYSQVICKEIKLHEVGSADRDEKGDLSIDYHTYIDDAYNLQLTYTSLFSDIMSVDNYGYVNFQSIQDSNKLIYWVIQNNYNLTVDEFLEEINYDALKAKIIGGNVCAGLVEAMDQESGEVKAYASYWLVEEDYVAVAAIECMNLDEAARWYDMLEDGIVNIDVISKMDHDETGEVHDDYDMQEYYDAVYDQILGYPTLFLSEGMNGTYNGRSCIEFESKMDNNKLFYLVLANTYEHNSESYAAAINALEVEVLPDQTVISRMEDVDADGNPVYYNLFSLVDTDKIVVVTIDCEDLDSSIIWYERLKNGAIYINNFSGEQAVSAYKVSMNGEDLTDKMALTVIDQILYVEAKSYFESLVSYGNPKYYCTYNENAAMLDIYSWSTDVRLMYLEPGIDGLYRYTDMNVDRVEDDFEFVTFDAPILTLENDEILLPIVLLSDYLDDGYDHVTIEKQ